jgi:hypothetical protein
VRLLGLPLVKEDGGSSIYVDEVLDIRLMALRDPLPSFSQLYQTLLGFLIIITFTW